MSRRWLLVLGLLVALAAPLALALRAGALPRLGGGCDAPVAFFDGPEPVRLDLEVARTPEERARGLMFRDELDWDRGMLFVFPEDTTAAFWMRNTLIPLSIAFLDETGTVLDLQDMEPLDETPHPPAAPYRYALEVNQGWFEAHGVSVGGTFSLCFDHGD